MSDEAETSYNSLNFYFSPSSMSTKTDNLKIRATHVLISPSALAEDLPLNEAQQQQVMQGRKQVEDILHGRDDRLLVIVGPCSIHDPKAGLEYAQRLAVLADQYRDSLCIVMRVYFEKPRTRMGWKGLINDPALDGSYRINHGLGLARKFLLDVTTLGLPAATEFLDTTFGQYFSDLISLGAIGARTTESQVHRELASGLSMPVGFKNRTDGNLDVAIDAIIAAGETHSFPSITKDGAPAIMETTGNPDCFLILRGGSNGPNYHQQDVHRAAEQMLGAGIKNSIIVDCSHGNSEKDYRNQSKVVTAVCAQIKNPHSAIRGVMIESFLQAGKQNPADIKQLEYGKSITDGCIDWNETVTLIGQLAGTVSTSN